MRRAFLVLAVFALLGMSAGCGSGDVTPSPTPFSNVPQGDDPIAVAQSTDVPSAPSQAACQITPPIGQPLPNLPPVTTNDWVLGATNAPVTLITYSDFQ
jgi:hypothetical protein